MSLSCVTVARQASTALTKPGQTVQTIKDAFDILNTNPNADPDELYQKQVNAGLSALQLADAALTTKNNQNGQNDCDWPEMDD